MVSAILFQQGKSHLTIGEDTLDTIYKQVELEMAGFIKKCDIVAELCQEDEIKQGHIALVHHTINLLHGCDELPSCIGDEDKSDDASLRMARDRRECVERERKQYNNRLLENHRRRVSNNASFIRNTTS